MTATITIELSITREAEVEMTTRKRKKKKDKHRCLGEMAFRPTVLSLLEKWSGLSYFEREWGKESEWK